MSCVDQGQIRGSGLDQVAGFLSGFWPHQTWTFSPAASLLIFTGASSSSLWNLPLVVSVGSLLHEGLCGITPMHKTRSHISSSRSSHQITDNLTCLFRPFKTSYRRNLTCPLRPRDPQERTEISRSRRLRRRATEAKSRDPEPWPPTTACFASCT